MLPDGTSPKTIKPKKEFVKGRLNLEGDWAKPQFTFKVYQSDLIEFSSAW